MDALVMEDVICSRTTSRKSIPRRATNTSRNSSWTEPGTCCQSFSVLTRRNRKDTMQWSDVTAPPSRKMLRQFAGCGSSSSAAWRRGARGRGRRTVGVWRWRSERLWSAVSAWCGRWRSASFLRMDDRGVPNRLDDLTGRARGNVLRALHTGCLHLPVDGTRRVTPAPGRSAVMLACAVPPGNARHVFQAVLDRRHDGKF